MKFNTLFLLFILVGVGCGGTPAKKDGRPKEKKKIVKKEEPKVDKNKAKKSKGILESFSMTANTAPAYQKYRLVRDGEALRLVKKNTFCKELQSRNTCPWGTKEKWSVGLNGDEISDCMVQCQTSQNNIEGPYERILMYGRNEVNFDRGFYKKNRPDGKWTRGFFQCEKGKDKCREKRQSESIYKSGVGLHGLQRDWARNGKLIRKQMYKNGSPRGELMEWWDDGKKRTKGTFKNGVLVGKYYQWHQNGKHSLKSKYKNGALDGVYTRFDYEGVKIESGKYSSGIKIGKWANFYSKGKPKSIARYDKKGRPDGKFCNWKSDGSVIGCFRMTKGNGTFLEYSYNGIISHQYTMKNGQKDGKESHYGYDGNLVSEVEWKEGQQHGLYIQWDHDGRVVSELEYRHNELHGRYFQRYWSGERSTTTQGQYCRNRQCGVWEYAMEDGRYREERYSSTGIRISEKSYSPDGELESEWPSKNGNSTYESCVQKMLNGGCCQPATHLPSGARICVSRYP